MLSPNLKSRPGFPVCDGLSKRVADSLTLQSVVTEAGHWVGGQEGSQLNR